jgi:exodeoxyribonuclease-5
MSAAAAIAPPVDLNTAKWSPQQEHALAEVDRWLKGKPGKGTPQIFRLFGFAGTGKTTLARELADKAGGTVLFATFTGKASLVLRSKGCWDASTIHSLIYKPEQDPITGEFTFKLNHDSALSTAKLLIVDEVSMVGEELAVDLLKFNKPILVLGDPAQLPPVKDTGYFINARPDVMLTEVHRQARDNPIIHLSMLVREGKRLEPGTYGDTVLIDRNNCDRLAVWAQVSAADQLLCGMNKTRAHSNTKIRRESGLAKEGDPKEWLPVMGDRLICLRNQRENGLLNGMLFDCLASELAVHKKLTGAKMRVKSLDQPNRAPIDVNTPREFFEGKETDLDWKAIREHQQFTFGWAITVHKSQGSQWGHVGIINEAHVFREDADKWLYTAITRASERVTMVI